MNDKMTKFACSVPRIHPFRRIVPEVINGQRNHGLLMFGWQILGSPASDGRKRQGLRGAIHFWLLCIGFLLIAGCTKDDSPAPDKLEGHLTVYAIEGEGGFYNQYGNLLYLKYPQVTFEMIDDSEAWTTGELINLLNEKKPDLLISSYLLYKLVVDQDMLLDLTSLIQRTKFDLGFFSHGNCRLDQGYGEWLHSLTCSHL